jgi:hypothetical protein
MDLVSARQRGCSKVSLETKVPIHLLLFLRGRKTTFGDISKHFFDLLDGEIL